LYTRWSGELTGPRRRFRLVADLPAAEIATPGSTQPAVRQGADRAKGSVVQAPGRGSVVLCARAVASHHHPLEMDT
jgi:hypothetical protein